ncbi:hypothetical protein AB1Y20_016594 [Prymnesium parvum]|uniref:Uncharacterized protein n=1 Tax=Prymnesium parvum TaxID=97485 RepID=A0AB34IAJ3_PRYPA
MAEEALAALRAELAALAGTPSQYPPPYADDGPSPFHSLDAPFSPTSSATTSALRHLIQQKEAHAANLREIERMWRSSSPSPPRDPPPPPRDPPPRHPSPPPLGARPNFARPLLPDDPPPPAPPPPPPPIHPLAYAPSHPSTHRPASSIPTHHSHPALPTHRPSYPSYPSRPSTHRPSRPSTHRSHPSLPRPRSAGPTRPPAAAAVPPPLPLRPATARPASAPPSRPRVTVPRPFSFEARAPRTTTSMRKLQQDLAAQQEELARARAGLKARPVPEERAPLYAPPPAKPPPTKPLPFSFAAPRPKPSHNEAPPPAPAFVARPIPESMNQPKWERMQLEEAERRERLREAAMQRLRSAKLPPRMERAVHEDHARRSEEFERIRRELHAECTHRPRINEGKTREEFEELHARFEIAKEKKRQAKQPTVPQPFRMVLEQLKEGNRHYKVDSVESDMRRDELFLPERRWPYLSTRAPVAPTKRPEEEARAEAEKKKAAKKKAAAPPQFGTTISAELRRAHVEEEKMRREQAEERLKREAAEREARMVAATREISAALGGGDVNDVSRRAELRDKVTRKAASQSARESQKEFDARLEEMKQRVARRPKLFQQVGVDIEVQRAKQAAHDKFEEVLIKNNLTDLLREP